MAKRRKPLPLDADGFPSPLRWRPVIKISALLLGVILTVGAAVLVQQLGETVLTLEGLLVAVLLGLFIGIAAPSIGRLVGVLWGNALIRKARREHAAATPPAPSEEVQQ